MNSEEELKYFCSYCDLLLSDKQNHEHTMKIIIFPQKILIEYIFISFIARGSFGFVFKIHERNNLAQELAIKLIIFDKNEDIYEIEKESNMLKALKHKNIIDFKKFIKSEDGQCCAIITEYAPDSLRNQMNRGNLSYELLINYAIQIIDTLNYIHNEHIPHVVHGDLKPENILIIKDNIKLIDFGVSRWVTKFKPETEKVFGTQKYWPPEIRAAYKNNKVITYNTKMDVYAFGLVLFEMLYNTFPTRKNLNKMLTKYVLNEDLRNIFISMLEKNPNERAESSEILTKLTTLKDKIIKDLNDGPNPFKIQIEAEPLLHSKRESIYLPEPFQYGATKPLQSNDILKIEEIKLEDGAQIINFPNNEKYEGEIENNKKNGKGKYYFNNGDIYDGDWKNDKMEGKGKLIKKKGETYEGCFINNQYSGQGLVIYQNGDIYQGEFKDGKREGHAKLTCKQGEEYIGDFFNDKFHGKGSMTYQNGDHYQGLWSEGKKEGYGYYKWKSGASYDGLFKNGEFIKQIGKYVSASGKIYEGEIKSKNLIIMQNLSKKNTTISNTRSKTSHKISKKTCCQIF